MAEPVIIGAATLYLGDCLDLLPTLEAVDHTMSDPPYGQHVYDRLSMPNTKEGSGTPNRIRLAGSYQKNNGPRVAELAAGAIGSIDDILDVVATEIARLSKRWSLVFSDLESCHLWRMRLEDAGARYVRTGAWVKPDAMPQFSGDRPSVGFEPCTITHAQGPMRWNGGGKPAVWTCNTVKGNSTNRPDHPCPKPLPLMREIVGLFSDPGETILDPFMGSGTTGAAAILLGRRFVGIERDPAYFATACNRLRDVEGLARQIAADHPAPGLFDQSVAA